MHKRTFRLFASGYTECGSITGDTLSAMLSSPVQDYLLLLQYTETTDWTKVDSTQSTKDQLGPFEDPETSQGGITYCTCTMLGGTSHPSAPGHTLGPHDETMTPAKRWQWSEPWVSSLAQSIPLLVSRGFVD